MEGNFSEKNIKSKYKHAIVRDLAWVVQSPSLQYKGFALPEWSPAFYEEFYKGIESKLKIIDQNPVDLKLFIRQNNTRLLGTYFEALVNYAFQIHPEWSIKEFQYQIHKDGITKGELDFIVQHQTDRQIYHIETAVKYYLANTSKLTRDTLWYGPNAKDRLDLKFSKMQKQQIPMLQESKYRDREVVSKTWIKGGLFVPFNSNEQMKSHANMIGTWCTISELKTLIANDFAPFRILDKRDWLSGLQQYGIGEQAQKKAIDTHFKSKNAFALLLKNQLNGSLLFVVPNAFRQKIKPEF